jgi:hypothetical protein
VLDPAKPPTGANLNLPTLRILVEPYPQLISGTPRSWGFDSRARRFTVRYTTRRASGAGSFPAGSVTEIATPAFVYARGYAAEVRGGAIVSPRGAGVLRIASCRASSQVAVTVTPSGRSRGSCRATLRVSIAPSNAALRHATTFHISVTALLGSFRQPVPGATVHFAQRVARTDDRGRAAITVVLHRRVRPYRAVALAAGFAPGEAFVSAR